MERPMTEWNDDRLDELNERVKDGFAEVDKRFEQVASREELSEVKVQLNRLNDRFDRLLFILIGACVGLIGTLLVAALGFVVQS